MNIAVFLSSESPDISSALTRAGMTPIEFFGDEPSEILSACQGYILAREFSPADHAITQVIKQQSQLGKPILGMAAGARLLVDTGLVPGLDDHQVAISIDYSAENNVNRLHIQLADGYQWNAFTRHLTLNTILPIVLLEKEKFFLIPPVLLTEMQLQGQTVFSYVSSESKEYAIAAVSNKMGNVMAMLPYLENTEDNDAVFRSMHDYIAEGYVQQVNPMFYIPRNQWL